MAGIVGLTELQHTNATSAVTINSNGTMTPAKMVYTAFTITSDQHAGTATGYEAITNWVSLPAPHTTLGPSITHNSGIFTFPHTGKYRITLNAAGYGNGGARAYAGGQIKYSSNSGGSYANLSRCISNCYTATSYFNASCTVLIEITNTATESIRFNSYASGNIFLTYNDNSTMCIFEQVG